MLVPCPHCQVHCKPREIDCPHCGGRLRRRDGSVPLTAAAAILGLSVAAGCESTSTPVYGAPEVTSGVGAQGGAGGAGGDMGGGGNLGGGGSAGAESSPDYGVAGSGG